VIKQAVILVGGLGTRLGVLTKHIPKPMLNVNGKPFAFYLVKKLKRQGIKNIIFSTGYYADQFVDYFGDGSDFGVNIVCIEEPQALGTGGAIKFLKPYLDEEFIVMNGDSLFDINYVDLYSLLPKESNFLVAMALRGAEDSNRYGQVKCDGILVTDFTEKDYQNSSTYINGGVYVMKKKTLNFLPKGVSSLEKDLFPSLALNRKLLGKSFTDYFIDIGIPEDFKRIQAELPNLIKNQHII
jgi:D-glycero-alpha-D-manno-heptose 1-phosphate guanylyltransferase